MKAVLRAMLVGGLCAATLPAATWYVSYDGVDGAGRGSENAPYRTIQYAVDKMASGDVCYVKRGIYRETVTFKTNGVQLKALGPGPVVISGADVLGGWTRHQGDIWKAPVSWDLGKTCNQLFINGKWSHEARFPNIDDWDRLDCNRRESQRPNRCGDREYLVEAFPEEETCTVVRPTTLHTTFIDFADSGDLHKGYPREPFRCHFFYKGFGEELESPAQNPYNVMYGKPKNHFVGASFWSQGWWWGGGGEIMDSWDEADGTFHFKVKTDRIRWAMNGVFIGHYDFIDIPGEWVLKDGYVYLKVPPTVDVTRDEISFKRRHAALVLNHRSNITVEGLTVIGSSALLDSANNCTIDKCTFYCLSHYMTYDYQKKGYVAQEDSVLFTGNRGIVITGSNNTFKNSSVTYSAGHALYVNGTPNTIENNLIRFIDYPNTYAAGVYIRVQRLKIKHNTFTHFGRSALTGGQVCEITHNKFLNAMYLSGDGGTIYSSRSSMTTSEQFAYNVFSGCFGQPSAYIYNDNSDTSVNDVAHHNLFLPNPRSKGKFIPHTSNIKYWYNNTFAAQTNERDPFVIWDDSTRKVPWSAVWKNNLLALDTSKDWRFTNAAAGDYSLQKGSYAIDKGKPIDGFTNPFSGTAPDLGAYEFGKPAWQAGHDWGEPLLEEKLWSALQGTNAVRPFAAQWGAGGVELRETPAQLAFAFARSSGGLVEVFDMRGRCCISASSGPSRSVVIDKANLAPAHYLVKVTLEGQQLVKTMLVMR